MIQTEIRKFKSRELLLIGMLLIVFIGSIYDLVEDIGQGNFGYFFFVQIITIISSMYGLYLLVQILIRRRQEILRLNQKVAQAEGDLKKSYIKLTALAKAYNKQILEQFNLWKLTPSEKEVALLILKGLSFKEVARVRSRQEKTIRHQASVIYSKSGVSGRHEFSAWFFEDVLGV